MSGPSLRPWSDNPNAPKIPYALYFGEKSYFAGVSMGAIFYGIVVVLFFQCMNALFDPVNRTRGGFKWGLAIHTMAMFSCSTIYIAMSINIQSISFIDNREFPGIVGVMPPGPVGYQFFIHSRAIGIAPTPMILLNGWLADGLLLYRCYVIYARNYWVIIFPCLVFLASLSQGIMFIYQTTRPENLSISLAKGTPYLSITFALNMILTLMIVTRLVLQRRNIQNALGSKDSAGGFYKTVITIIIESYSISAISFLLYAGTWAANSFIQYVFLQILAQAESISQFLITIRVANQRAITSDSFASGNSARNVGSIHFENRGIAMGGSGTLPGGYPTRSTGTGEVGVGVETTIDLYPDRASKSEDLKGP